MTPDEKAKAPDAEVVSEEKHDIKPKVERVTVVRPDEEESETLPSNLAKIRVITQSKHPLDARIFEVDEDGWIDIIISDADVN